MRQCLEDLGLSITAGAKALGVSRLALSNVVNGKNGVSPEMAVRLAKAFGGGPHVWLGMQVDYDLRQVDRNKIKVRAIKPQEAA